MFTKHEKVYSFARTAITEYHGEGCVEQQNCSLTVLEARGLRSRAGCADKCSELLAGAWLVSSPAGAHVSCPSLASSRTYRVLL